MPKEKKCSSCGGVMQLKGSGPNGEHSPIYWYCLDCHETEEYEDG